MKKSVKLIIILLLVFFVGVGSVSAISTDKTVEYRRTKTGKASAAGLIVTNGSSYKKNHSTSMYEITGDGKTFVSYCMDPHKDPANYYVLGRILGSDGSIGVQAYDMGVLEILKHAYTQINTSYSLQDIVTPESSPNRYEATLSGDNLYLAASIAIRAFTLGLYGWGGAGRWDSVAYYGVGSAHVNLGISWAAWGGDIAQTIIGVTCGDYSDCTKRFTNLRKSSYNWYKPSYVMSGYSLGNEAYDVIYAAQELFYHALSAAEEVYANQGIASSTVKGSVVSTEMDGSRTEDTVQEFHYVNIEISDFSEEAYVNNFNLTCTNCSSSGITFDYMEYYNEANEWVSLTPDVDISKVLTPGENGLRNGTVRIRVHFTKTVLDEEECENATYNITYDYFDPSIEYVGAILYAKNETDKQRMLIIEKSDGQANSDSISGTVGCANPVCETELSIPICSDEEDEAISEIHAPEDIKKCILDNVDDAGNSYNLVEDLGGVSSSNEYCQVFCKEDYFDVIDDGIQGGIKLNPQIGSGEVSDEENVNCGAYFQLTAHVEGKKDCYTSGVNTEDKEINKEKYLEDIIQAQRDMIEAYDDYLNYTQAKADTGTRDWNCGSTCSGSCGTKQEYATTVGGTTYTGYEVLNVNEETGEVTGHFVSGKTHYSASTGKSTCSTGSTSCPPCGDDGCSTCCVTTSSTCDPGSYSDLGLEGLIQDAIDRMGTAYERYIQIITDYNACTAGWAIEFPFEQKLSFYYNEYQGDDAYQPYFDLLSKSDLDEESLYYLEAQEDTLEEEYEIEICTGTTTGEYECEDTPFTYEEMNPSIQDYNYASEYGEVYTDRTFTICDANGCDSDTQPISDATFIRKTVKKAQSYITPSVFYQIESNGRVTVRQADYEGSIIRLNKITLEELTNSLPITTLATGGGEFRLMLEDLGEFYTPLSGSADNNGRLIDFGRVDGDNGENVIPGDNKDSSVAEAVGESGIEKFSGDYVCYYYSDCRPDDCPNCEFVCEDDDCHWEECPECNFDCVGCIINLDELQINFKPISTVTVESADRELGYNWNVNTTLAALSLLRDKAELTISEIESENETIYTKTGDDSALDFSIRLNGDIIEYLKEYNASVEDAGGYANDSLECYAYTDDNGKTYANMFCYSEVIDYLVDEYSDQITVDNRTPEGGRSDNNNSANSSGYWSLWEGWTESEKINGQYSVIGGPAWK